MARHNDAIIYGFVQRAPDIYISDDPAKPVCKGMTQLLVVKDYRKQNTFIDKINFQNLLIISGNKEQVEQMKRWEQGDMVLVKGAITTKDINKKKTCPHCNNANIRKGNVVFINPIWSDILEKNVSVEEAAEKLKQRSEISNKIMVLGELCTEPKAFTLESGVLLTTYQMQIYRKFMVKETHAEDRVDFPWVKTYGKIAKTNLEYLRNGSTVLIDGYVQTRKIVKHPTCEFCGKSFDWPDVSVDIVPYSVEFLKNYRTKEEIEAEEEQRHMMMIKKVFDEDAIDDETK